MKYYVLYKQKTVNYNINNHKILIIMNTNANESLEEVVERAEAADAMSLAEMIATLALDCADSYSEI